MVSPVSFLRPLNFLPTSSRRKAGYKGYGPGKPGRKEDSLLLGLVHAPALHVLENPFAVLLFFLLNVV